MRSHVAHTGAGDGRLNGSCFFGGNLRKTTGDALLYVNRETFPPGQKEAPKVGIGNNSRGYHPKFQLGGGGISEVLI